MVTLLKALGWLTIAASIIAAFIAAGAQAELNRIAATRQAGFEGGQLVRALQPTHSYAQQLAEHAAALKAEMENS